MTDLDDEFAASSLSLIVAVLCFRCVLCAEPFAAASAAMENASTANSSRSIELIPSAATLEPADLPAAEVDPAASPSAAELRAAARLIVDRSMKLDAEFRALPSPLFHDPPPPLLDPASAGSEADVDRALDEEAFFGSSLPSALLRAPSDVEWTESLVDAIASRETGSWLALRMFALIQLRVERHQAEAVAEMDRIAQQTELHVSVARGPRVQITLGWILWRHAAFSQCLHAEASWRDVSMLSDRRRPAHALHFLASMSDEVMRKVFEPAATQQNLRISRHNGDTVLVVRDEMHARCDQLWRDLQAASIADEATREQRLCEATSSFRQWIRAQQQSLPSRLRAAAVLSLSGFSIVDSCALVLSPIIDDPAAPIHLAERVGYGRTLLERLSAVCASSLSTADAGAAANAMAEIIQRLEERMRAQTDEQLERDAAFEAVARVCCEIPLTQGSAAHSLVDYLLTRLRRRLLASGSRLSLSPTFRWSDLLNGSLFFGAVRASGALPHRPMLRLLFAHGLTTNHNGHDFLVTMLEAAELDSEAALRDFFHPDCDDLSMSGVDWLAPTISVPSAPDPFIGAEPQFVLLEASSFEEERIRCMEATARDQQIDASTQFPVLAAAQEAHKDAAADTTLSQPTFNLLSAAEHSTPTLAADHFDLHAPPAEYSERMAQLGLAADCFSGPRPSVPQVLLSDNDLLRRMEARVRTRPDLLPRLDLLKSAASRWYRRCFPPLRAAVEAHLIPDLASMVLSFVTVEERVLRSLPPPPPLPLPAVGAFAPPRPSAEVDASAASSASAAAAPSSFGSFVSFGSGPTSAFGSATPGLSFGSQPFSFGASPSLAFAASTAAAPAFGFGSAPAFSVGTQPSAFGVSSSSVAFCGPTSAAPSSQPAVAGLSSSALAPPLSITASFASTAFGGGAPAPHALNAAEASADDATSSGLGFGSTSDESSTCSQSAEPTTAAADAVPSAGAVLGVAGSDGSAAGSVTAAPPVDGAELSASELRAAPPN